MIKFEDSRDYAALRGALLTLEQIARRSTDGNSKALAAGAAEDLRALVDSRVLEPKAWL